MKISQRLFSGLLGLIAVAVMGSPLFAQQAPKVAVLDVSKIFKEYPTFRKQLEDIKADVQAAENGLKSERDAIANMQKQLRVQHTPGSADYKRLEADIATRMSNLNLQMNLQKKGFMEKEAQVYHATYQQVQRETAYVASRYGIDVVLRYNSAPIDKNNRQSVLAGVNKTVVYHSGVDITDKVLERLQPPQRDADNRPINQFPR